MKMIRSTILVPAVALSTSILWACERDRTDAASAEQGPVAAQSEVPAAIGRQATLPDLQSFDRRRAYVASVGDGVISGIDLLENRVAWTLTVSEGTSVRPAEAAMGIAASRDGRWIYTGDAARDELVIVDGDVREIVTRIPLPHQVHAIDICPLGHILWVSGRHPDYPWLSRTTIIDARERTVVRTFTPGLGNDAHYAFTPDAAEVWGASVTTNLVSVYDAHTGEVLAAVPLFVEIEGTSPEAQLGLMAYNEVAIAPDGARAYIVGPESGTVYAVDVGARKAIDHVRVGERTHGVAVTRDGHEVWTANNAGSVTILDAATLDVLETIPLHDFQNETPFAHVAFSYDGTRAYVSFASDIAVMDVMTRALVARIEMGTDPHEISLEDYYVRLGEGRRVTPDRGEQRDTSASGAGVSRAGIGARAESRAAGITVGATLMSIEPRPSGGQALSFAVALDTHAGDLMEVDSARQVSVEIDGAPADAAVSWAGESESAHHRQGTLHLSFDVRPTRYVTLVFRDVGVEERTLSFDLSGAQGP